MDTTTDTYQWGTRTYNPTTATWQQPDTAALSGAPDNVSIGTDPMVANRYSYVNGDPINYTDPTGHIMIEGNESRPSMSVEHTSDGRAYLSTPPAAPSCGDSEFHGPCVISVAPQDDAEVPLVALAPTGELLVPEGAVVISQDWFEGQYQQRYGDGTYAHNYLYVVAPGSLDLVEAGSDENLVSCLLRMCSSTEWVRYSGSATRLSRAADGVVVEEGAINLSTVLSSLSVLGDGSTEPPDPEAGIFESLSYLVDLLGLNTSTRESTGIVFTPASTGYTEGPQAVVRSDALVYQCHDLRCQLAEG